MSYQEPCTTGALSRKQAKRLLGADWLDFLEANGDRTSYSSLTISNWIGA
jgi:hypothetical protein